MIFDFLRVKEKARPKENTLRRAVIINKPAVPLKLHPPYGKYRFIGFFYKIPDTNAVIFGRVLLAKRFLLSGSEATTKCFRYRLTSTADSL